jgi:hypothetical protein
MLSAKAGELRLLGSGLPERSVSICGAEDDAVRGEEGLQGRRVVGVVQKIEDVLLAAPEVAHVQS